jgi:hypothetical protein
VWTKVEGEEGEEREREGERNSKSLCPNKYRLREKRRIMATAARMEEVVKGKEKPGLRRRGRW